MPSLHWHIVQLMLPFMFPCVSTCSPASNLNEVPLQWGVSASGRSAARVKVRLFFLHLPFCRRVKTTVSSFYPGLYLCVSILHILIAPWTFTLTVSNGIACRGHRPWSRSCKCTAHVCANLPIDSSLAPVSGRIEPSVVLFLSRPYLDSSNVLEIQLKPNLLECRTSILTSFSFT